MKPELFFNNRENICIVVDGKEIWQSRSIAISTIFVVRVKNEDYVLLIQRSDLAPDFKRFWANITGYLDGDETLPDALRREMYEEAGLDVKTLLSEGTVIQGSFDIPSYTESDVFDKKQNVSIRYTLVLELDKLPEIYLGKECMDGKFYLYSDLINLIDRNEIQLAFNHKKLLLDFYNTYKRSVQPLIVLDKILKIEMSLREKSTRYVYMNEHTTKFLGIVVKRYKEGIYNTSRWVEKKLLTIDLINDWEYDYEYVLENNTVYVLPHITLTLINDDEIVINYSSNELCISEYNKLLTQLKTI